jgi:NAD(P)H-hydrate epimerase
MSEEIEPVQGIPACPPRPADAHKGTFGTVIVVGGSATMLGAPALCATAAFRGGAGLVKIASLPNVLHAAIIIEPSATGIMLDLNPDLSAARLDEADAEGKAVLAVGPGMGRSEPMAELLDRLLAGKRTMVLDADGLNLLAERGSRRSPAGAGLIVTPHPGEFRRLAGPLGIEQSPTDAQSRPRAAGAMAKALDAIVVLKGRHTIVSDGRRWYRNDSGSSALATAGSGDILTGLIAALAAQGMDRFDAAVLGVYLHGVAAELWVQRHGRSGLVARDLAAWLPTAFESHR